MADSIDVWLGNAPCSGVTAVSSSWDGDILSCTVPNYESNYYHVDVHVQGKGFASVSPTPLSPGLIRNSTVDAASSASPYPRVFLEAVVDSISPSSGSVFGGCELTLSGGGFSMVPERMSVSVGEITCVITASSHSELRCITGPSPRPNRDTSLDLFVTVNGYAVSRSLQYTYSISDTPLISGLSIQHATGGETLVISGMEFGMHPRVLIVSSVMHYSGGTEAGDECVRLFSNSNQIMCTLPEKQAGTYQVLVITERLGFAGASVEGGDTIAYTLSVDNFSPMYGGFGGGIELTVTGHGFPSVTSTDDAEFSVTLCDTPCSVFNSSLLALSCILSPIRAQQVSDSSLNCSLTVHFNTVTATSNDSFVFLDVLTPRLSSISPNIGGTAGGTRVTLMGWGFYPPDVITSNQLSASDVIVSIDGTACEWEDMGITDTTIICQTTAHRTTLKASVEVTVRGKGRAIANDSSDSPVTFEYVDLWSSRFTWGGQSPPDQGESVHIRSGQTVFLDISPPELNLILIEGALIFSDAQDLHLQAKYIFVNNGTLQVSRLSVMQTYTSSHNYGQ